MAERRGKQRCIRLAAPCIAAGSERAERVAVIALAARDEVPALRLAALDEILSRELDARFDRLGDAADEIGIGQSARLMAKAGDGRAAGGIEHAPSVLGKEIDTFAADRPGRRFAQGAVQHAAGAWG